MPVVIPYPRVLEVCVASGLKCLYHNSGAFAPLGEEHRVGWISQPDPTIRAELQADALTVPPELMPRLLVSAWLTCFTGPVWIMPMSHWAHELRFGSASWLPQYLSDLGIDPAPLAATANAPALEFQPHEHAMAMALADALLHRLVDSDFSAVLPAYASVAVIHHHRQVWWRCADATLADRLRNLPPPAE